MKPISMNKLLISLFIIAGLFATQAEALNLGKALKDAVEEKVEEVKNGSDVTSAEPPQNATEVGASKNVTETDAPAVQAQANTINWRNPSQAEEIALGRNITGSLLGAAPLVKDEALQLYINKVGRWVASQSERADLPWKFGVIESSDLNAFAAPGGYVLITKGLYQKDRKSVV